MRPDGQDNQMEKVLKHMGSKQLTYEQLIAQSSHIPK